jgi:hypothetical protein
MRGAWRLVLAVCSVIVVPLGLTEIWRWRKTNRLFASAMGLIVLYFGLPHSIILPQYRCMYQICPFLILGECAFSLRYVSRLLSRVGRENLTQDSQLHGTTELRAV